jgi:MoxR-like ATPase
MKIRIQSKIAYLADSLADHLQMQGYERPIVIDDQAESLEIIYGSAISQADLNTLITAVKPLNPKFTVSKDVESDLVLLKLGDPKNFSDWEIKIYADSDSFAQKIKEKLSPLGFGEEIQVKLESKHLKQENTIKFGGASPFFRQAIRWFLAQHQVKVVEDKSWDKDDNDIWLYLKDPQYEGRDLKNCFEILVKSDDVAQLIELKSYLETAGYEKVNIQSIDTAEMEDDLSFLLDVGHFKRDDQEANYLKSIVEIFMDRLGVDTMKHPLIVKEDDMLAPCQIIFPYDQYLKGELRPTTGPYKDRWNVFIYTDEPEKLAPLAESLKDAGYLYTKIEKVGMRRRTLGPQIEWGAAIDFESVTEEIGELVDQHLAELCESLSYPATKVYSNLDVLDDRDDEINHHNIVIELPIKDLAPEVFEQKLKEITKKYSVTVKSKKVADLQLLTTAIKNLEFNEFSAENEGVDEPVIQFGGAPVALLTHLSSLVEQYVGLKCEIKRVWSREDHDIWIDLPTVTLQQSQEVAQLDLDSWFAKGPNLQKKIEAFVKLTEKDVSIAHLKLLRQPLDRKFSHLVPRSEEFQHYCLDQRTAETLEHVVESVIMREPCLLEGETSVSKTSIIQYLAMLTNQPLVRLNLNGQTDTAELIGRFIPHASQDELPIAIEDLMSARETLSPVVQQILAQAEAQNRSLNELEIQQIIHHEGLAQKNWKWQHGLIVQAMIHGWWVVLDELNLAEPQILERLNSLLERNPSLVLTEYDHQSFGNEGTPIHPNFRLFATMNPAEYAGRSPLSPAYRDRWRAYRYVQNPSENDYVSMLTFLVFGQNPNVRIYGKNYLGTKIKNPPFAQLAKVKNIQAFLKALAQFHCALENAVGKRGSMAKLGNQRRDKYVFTRRGLLSVMDYLLARLNQGDAKDQSTQIDMKLALNRYYLSRCTNGADQNIVMQLLNASGIGLHSWKI